MWWLWLALFLQSGSAPPTRPNAVLGLVDQARGLPPEFSADTLLRIAGSPLVSEPAWKRELVEEAFRTASHAPLPFRRRAGPQTDQRSTHDAWDHGLEALTLQTRAVEAMIALDPLRARAMYEEIALPDLGNPSCRDILTPNVDALYETALKVLPRGFTDKEREKGEPLRLLEAGVRTMQAPEQVPAVGRMILDAKLPPAGREHLLGVFAVTLDRVNGSDRVFARNEFELARILQDLMRTGQAAAALMAAMRGYIVRQAAVPRCSDGLIPKNLANSVRDFNLLVQQLNAAGAAYTPISSDEFKALKDEGTFQDDRFWQSPRSKQVLDALKWLNHGNRDLPDDKRFWTLEERSTMTWNQHYLDTLKLLDGWNPDEEPAPADYYAMKAHAYMLLAGLVPPGKARDNAMGTFRTFLEQSYFLIENHNFWFTDVGFMLGIARAAKDPADRAWLLDELSRSANPVIALYARLEKSIPSK
jgi:hypothetical protein